MKIPVKPVAPQEPDHPMRFADRSRLEEHVRKHVIAGRAEKWWRRLGEDRIGNARRELAAGRPGTEFRALAQDYQDLVSQAILAVTAKGQDHVHGTLVALEVGEEGAVLSPRTEEISCFDTEAGIYVAAGRPVRNGEHTRYSLRTSYTPMNREGRIMKRPAIKVKTLERMAVHGIRLIADHWGTT